jgi:hypothetical protein
MVRTQHLLSICRSEFRTVINSLWKGDLVQINNDNNDVVCTAFSLYTVDCPNKQQTFLRLTVWTPHFGTTSPPFVSLFLGACFNLPYAAPVSDVGHSYQSSLRILIWFFFLVVYSQAGTPPFSFP